MKKQYKLLFCIGIIVGLIISFFLKSSVTIEFTFSKSDIVKIEMYHYEGVPAAEECKIITGREDIDTLHKELQNIKVRDRKKNSEPMTGGSATRFIFVLSDGTEYDLEYYNSGGIPSLSSKAGNFEYQTSAKLEKYWTKLDYELVEKELEMIAIDEYNEKLEKKQEEWAEKEIASNIVEEVTQERPTLSEDEKQDILEYTYFSDIEEKVTADDVVNLRDIPSQDIDSTVLRQLKNGEIAVRTGISDTGWSRLVIDGETYYAVTSYLTTDLEYRTPDENGKAGLKTQFATVSQKVTPKIEVNLRKLPSVTNPDATVVATVRAGEVFIRTGISQEHGWSRVEYNGETLYCVSSYVEIVE